MFMNDQQFIKDFEEQFDDLQPGSLTLDTELESLDEWSSLQALTIIAMIDSKYGIRVSGSEVNDAKTVGEIYNLIKNKS
jgi:acyl carrier protein